MTLARKVALAVVFAASTSLVACGGTEAGVSGTSAAATVEECQGGLTNLVALTQVLQFADKAKDLTGLLGKLDAAEKKLAAGKLEDAIQKLSDFQKKLTSLAADGKVVEGVDANGVTVTPQDVIAAADASIACITALLPAP
jgi:hypothetical protein